MLIISVSLLSAYGIGIKFYRENLRLPFMLIVCLLSFLPVILRSKFKSALLGYIGVHSLEIYLWHVLPIMVLKYLFKDTEPQYLYYSLAFGMIFIMLGAIQIKIKLSA